MKHIITGIIILTVISCNKQQSIKELDEQFIDSYSELNKECTEVLSEILKPYEIENDTLSIDKAFRLDVKFDSALYSPEELQYNFLIGLKLKPDLYKLIVFDIDFKLGAITRCEILPNESLIINNYQYLFTDLTKLLDCKGLNIPDSLVAYTSTSKTLFRQVVWTNRMYGEWKLGSTNKKGFKSEKFNNSWIFSEENNFLLMNSERDTLLVDRFDLQGENLRLVESEKIFEIVTYTQNGILIREKGDEDLISLIEPK